MRTFLVLLIPPMLPMRPGVPAGQASAGFAGPQDISTLLNDRLSDWICRLGLSHHPDRRLFTLPVREI